MQELEGRSPHGTRVQRQTSISDFRPGDLAVFAPVSWRYSPLGWLVGHTVSIATWPWDLGFQACHVGLVAPFAKQPYAKRRLAFYEATIDKGLGSCLHAGRSDIKGVQVHPLKSRLKLHLGPRGGRAWRLPLLHGLGRCFTSLGWCESFLEQTCCADLAVPYDRLGAFQARCFGLGWSRRFRRAREDANQSFFCSEWAAKIYQDMEWLDEDVIPSHENPKSLVKLLVERGICGLPEEITL